MNARVLLLVLSLLVGACATVRNWREARSGPASRAEVYDSVEFFARSDGFAPSVGECDRGLGVWVSRWRYRQIGLGHPGRYRLHVEVDFDDGSNEAGWPVRYLVEQQRVKDLGRSLDPGEGDWSDDGQDFEREYIFGRKISMGIHGAAPVEPADDSRGRR